MILALEILAGWLAFNAAFVALMFLRRFIRDRRERIAELDLISLDNVIPLRRSS
jgi:hypothetical protein